MTPVANHPPIVRVGTIAWGKRHWRGHFYPPGLPKDQWLRYASARMRTIEIDVTFYADQTPKVFQGWRDRVPDDFAFAVKGQRDIAIRSWTVLEIVSPRSSPQASLSWGSGSGLCSGSSRPAGASSRS